MSRSDERTFAADRSTIGRRLGGGAVAAALLLALPLLRPSDYLLHLVILSSIAAVAAVGLNVTNGYLGMLNLTPAAFVGLGAYTSAVLSLAGVPVTLAIGVAMAVGAATGVGVSLAFLRMRGFFFALATLAVGEVVALLALNLEDVTRGPLGLPGIPRPSWASGLTSYYYLVVIVCTGVVALTGWLARSDLGLLFLAIRENERKAAAVGIPTYRYKVIGFAIAAVLMALSGALLAHYLQYLDPTIASLRTTTETVLMVILGGRGTIAGPIIGAFVITMGPEALRIAPAVRLILYGLALIVTITLMPDGLMGGVRRLRGGPESGVSDDG